MTLRGWLLAIIFAGLAACESSPGPAERPQPPSRAEIDALDSFALAWLSAYESGDFQAMRDLYEPDAWLMTRARPARKNREEILDYFAVSRQVGAKASMTFETEEITIDGPYAFKIAKWWLESPHAIGEPIRESGRSLVIFRRGADGQWRLWRDIDNTTPDVPFDARPE